MKNSRLLLILKSLSANELKEFEKFLRSPFFKCPKFVLNLFLLLKKYHPVFSEKNISNEKLFSKLYKGRKFNELLLRRMVSDLIRLSEEFLRYKNFKNNETFQNTCLLNELSKRDLEPLFRLKHNNIMKELEDKNCVDPSILLETYLVQTEMKNFRTHLRDDLMNDSYTDAIEVFSVFFIRAIYSYINHTKTFRGEIKKKSEIVSSVFRHFDHSGFIDDADRFNKKYSTYLKMINYCMLIIQNEDDRISFNKLKSLISENAGEISGYERLGCYVAMLRFCNFQNLKYNNEFVNESFEIQNIILNEKLFLEYSQYLQLSFCRNYIIKCKSLGKIDNMKRFLNDYKKYFSTSYKESFINYCKAIICFEEGILDESLQHASEADMDKAVFKLDLKILKIKIFYEKKYMDSLFSEIDSFRHFISANVTIYKDMLDKTKNFLTYVSALAKIKENHSTKDLIIIKKKIEIDTKLKERKWLLAKVSELV